MSNFTKPSDSKSQQQQQSPPSNEKIQQQQQSSPSNGKTQQQMNQEQQKHAEDRPNINSPKEQNDNPVKK